MTEEQQDPWRGARQRPDSDPTGRIISEMMSHGSVIADKLDTLIEAVRAQNELLRDLLSEREPTDDET